MSVTGWDGVTLTVEVALSAATSEYGLWDAGIWDDSLWGPDVVWTDVTAYVRQVDTSRSFSRGIRSWESGTATVVLDNRDGRFSPANLSGPYVSSGVTQIRPLRPLRIYATYASVVYPIYRGYVQEWQESWTVAAVEAGDAIVTLPCADELSRLAAVDGMEVTPVGAGDTAGQRIHRILDAAGHTGERSVDVGEHTMQATDLSADIVSELQLTTDSEGGAIYIDAAGTVVFAGKDALIEDTRSVTSQATFGDSGSELPYADIELAYDSDLLVNYVSYQREGGAAQNVYDSTSRALYGDRRDTRTDLICETDGQVLALAQWTVAQYKDPELRVTRIAVKPRTDPADLFPQVLGREVRDMVTVLRRPPGGHTIERDCHIAGVSHAITAADWVTTWDLWSASLYAQYAGSRWDSGEFDEALWFF